MHTHDSDVQGRIARLVRCVCYELRLLRAEVHGWGHAAARNRCRIERSVTVTVEHRSPDRVQQTCTGNGQHASATCVVPLSIVSCHVGNVVQHSARLVGSVAHQGWSARSGRLGSSDIHDEITPRHTSCRRRPRVQKDTFLSSTRRTLPRLLRHAALIQCGGRNQPTSSGRKTCTSVRGTWWMCQGSS